MTEFNKGRILNRRKLVGVRMHSFFYRYRRIYYRLEFIGNVLVNYGYEHLQRLGNASKKQIVGVRVSTLIPYSVPLDT